jgi:EpsI family protein
VAAIVAVGAGMHFVQYELDSGRDSPARPLRVALSQFPQQIGDWHAVTVGLEADALQMLQLSDFWAATYEDSHGAVISLFLGYYPDEAVGKLHQPTICYPGSGWTMVRTAEVRLLDDGTRNSGIEANQLLFTKGQNAELVLYWFHIPGATVANPTLSKLHRLVSVFRGGFSRSIVKVQVGLPVAESEEATLKRSEPFLRLMLDRLAEHLGPEWIRPEMKGSTSVLEGGARF